MSFRPVLGVENITKNASASTTVSPASSRKLFAIFFELLTRDVGSGFTLRRTPHDLPQLRSPSRRLWLLYFRRLGLVLELWQFERVMTAIARVIQPA
jgi:hypothetical protein